MEYLTDYQRAAKIRRINQLFSACRLTQNRPDVLALWGAESFEDMTDANLVACQEFLNEAYRCRTTPAAEPVRRLRSQVLTHLGRLGMSTATPEDWRVVNAYLLRRKICGRLLYMLNEDDLKALIRKLRAIQDKKNDTDMGAPRSVRDLANRPEITAIDDIDASQSYAALTEKLLAETGLLSLAGQTLSLPN